MMSAAQAMNDYRKIRVRDYARRLRPLDTLTRHAVSRRFIEAELSRPHADKTVVVTHHCPYRGGTATGHEQDVVSAAFVSDLSGLIERCGPDLWVYGHTHRSDDRLLGRTRLVSNAKGYGPHRGFGLAAWENAEFDPAFVVEI